MPGPLSFVRRLPGGDWRYQSALIPGVKVFTQDVDAIAARVEELTMMKWMRGRGNLAQLEQDLAEARQQAEEDRKALLRITGEFAEYRRRAERERAERTTAAQTTLLMQLLPILDDLRRAFGAAAPEEVASPWAQGILLVARHLAATLSALGLKRFGGMNATFDPRYHDVLATETRPDLPEGTVIQVVLPGYIFGGRILRHAQVVVSALESEGGQPCPRE